MSALEDGENLPPLPAVEAADAPNKQPLLQHTGGVVGVAAAARTTPCRSMLVQMTVPETPSPAELFAAAAAEQQQCGGVQLGRRMGGGGPGRPVSDNTPSKGRVTKAQRTDAADGECTTGAAASHQQPLHAAFMPCVI